MEDSSKVLDVEMNDDEENELLKSDEDSRDSAPPQEIEVSSDDDGDEEDEEKQIKAYINLLKVTTENRYSYDSYLQLTDIAQ